MTAVFNLLEADHREIDDLLYCARAATFATDRAGVYSAVDVLWARLAVHIRAEHLKLFPAVAAAGADESILEGLRIDHTFFMTKLGQGIKILDRTHDSVSEAEVNEIIRRLLDDVEARLFEHNELEERLIYPIAERMAAGDAERLRHDIGKELDNIPPRFAR